MKYTISVPDDMSITELKNEVDSGGRFIVYAYCISLVFAVTLTRMSKAYFIPYKEAANKYQKKYNTISYSFGWWAIPWGIIRTIEYTKFNRNGGLDVTKDIMLNIDEASLAKKEVVITLVHTIFKTPEKTEIASFKKAIFKKLTDEIKLQELVVGYFLNVPQGQHPYFVVGFRTLDDFETTSQAIKKALYTQFYTHTQFEFINLTTSGELNDILREQGLIII